VGGETLADSDEYTLCFACHDSDGPASSESGAGLGRDLAVADLYVPLYPLVF
jgi:hypothetical protein